MRMLHQTYRIISMHLNHADTTATAIVESNEDVLPCHLNGKPIGQPITLRERGRFLLHRLGATRRFVVWKVGLVG